MLNKRKRRPTHPGEIIREEILPNIGMTQEELAEVLGVTRQTLSALIHEKRAMSVDMAHRLAHVFNTTPDVWLNMQQAVDIWETHNKNHDEYERLKPIKTKVVLT
jgi:antitoxin HigA-1